MTAASPLRHERNLHELFMLNLALQLFDGVATYQGLRLGFREANPLLVSTFSLLGVGQTLLLFKALACGILLLLYRYRHVRLVPMALVVVAGVHLTLSFIPWSAKLLSVARFSFSSF